MCLWWERLLLPPRSVTVCLGTTHFILAVKWVNRVWSVQLPPHCRGVLAGMACGRVATVAPAAWSPRLYESQFLCTAVPNKQTNNKKQGKKWTLWGGWHYWLTFHLLYVSALSEDVCEIRRCCPQQWPFVNVSPSSRLLRAWFLLCSLQGRWIFLGELPPPHSHPHDAEFIHSTLTSCSPKLEFWEHMQ